MTTVTSLVYNCDPEGLNGIDQAAFADAFENEMRVRPQFRDCDITVTFKPALRSELVSVGGLGDLPDDPVEAYSEYARQAAERAFSHCCRAE